MAVGMAVFCMALPASFAASAIPEDNVVDIRSLTPSTLAPLPANETITIHAKVYYALRAVQGYISLVARENPEDEQPLASVTESVERGTGLAELSLPVTVPASSNIIIQAYLIPFDVTMSQAAYRVEERAPSGGSGDHTAPQADALKSFRLFVANYLLAVSQTNPDALEAMLHPELLDRITAGERRKIKHYFLNHMSRQQIPANHFISYRAVTTEHLEQLPFPWVGPWPLPPEAEAFITTPALQRAGEGYRVYGALHNQRWHLVVPMPESEQARPNRY